MVEWVCRSPHGERGLKSLDDANQSGSNGRSPHGERGLKLDIDVGPKLIGRSLPPRGAWIEIPVDRPVSDSEPVAPPTGSVD